MEQFFTPLDLIRSFYKELSQSENAAVAEALTVDSRLAAAQALLREGFEQLPRVKFNPSGKSIRQILQYSQQTAIHV